LEKMQLGIVFLSVIALVYGQCNWDYYWIPSEQSYYDLSSLELPGGSFSYAFTDWNSSIYWIWSVCGNLDYKWNPYTNAYANCKADSVACFQYTSDINSTWYSVGTYSSAVYENSVYGDNQGISVTFSNGDACGWSYRQSRFDFVCDQNYGYPTVTNIESSYCFDVITVNSSSACPNTIGNDGTTSWVKPGSSGVVWSSSSTYSSKPIGKIVAMAIGSFVGTGILCTIFVCCCVRRQERCKQRKKLQEMQNISIPQQTQPFAVPQFTGQPYPAGTPPQMPYPYPQYYFYYPPQTQPAAKPQSTQPAPPVVPLDEQMSDELLAKKLQAEFDKEAHN